MLFIGAFIGGDRLFNHGTYNFNKEYLTIFDQQSDCYYLQKVPANIEFRIFTGNADQSVDYAIVDSAGNTVASKYERATKNNYNIIPPSDGYTAGERYTLTLGAGITFTDENLKKARSLVFCIEREAVEKYEFTENVLEVSTIIQEVSENRILIEDNRIQTGKIVFGLNNNNEYVVYKIEEILDDKTAAVVTPAIDEIYSQLEVYGEYEFDVNNIASNQIWRLRLLRMLKKVIFILL